MFGPVGNVTFESLRQSAENYQQVPDNVDEGYVLGSTFITPVGEENYFVIVWSTIRLSTLNVGDVAYSDCTYKCTWNGYPVMIIGFSDKNCTFHPILVAVSSRETHVQFRFVLQTWKTVNPDLELKFLLADASEAVFNAAKTIWPGLVRLMCYAHVFLVRILLFLNCVNCNFFFSKICIKIILK